MTGVRREILLGEQRVAECDDGDNADSVFAPRRRRSRRPGVCGTISRHTLRQIDPASCTDPPPDWAYGDWSAGDRGIRFVARTVHYGSADERCAGELETTNLPRRETARGSHGATAFA